MKKKRLYQSPKSSVVEVRLFGSIAKGPNNPGGGGGGGIIELSRGNEGPQGARGQSFFDEEEFDDGFLNGGPNMFTDWEDKDRL